MKRRLSTMLWASALLLCVMTAALWLCTATGVVKALSLPPTGRLAGFRLTVYGSGVEVSRLIPLPPTLPLPLGDRSPERRAWVQQHGAPLHGEWFGVQMGDALAVARRTPLVRDRDVIGMAHYLQLPYWLPIVATGSLPLAHFVRSWLRHRRQRLAEGLCQKCGYDLRASKNRCPECGTRIPVRLDPPRVA